VLKDGRRGMGGSTELAVGVPIPSTGDSLKLSNKLGVDAHEMPLPAMLPKRNGGSEVSVVDGR